MNNFHVGSQFLNFEIRNSGGKEGEISTTKEYVGITPERYTKANRRLPEF